MRVSVTGFNAWETSRQVLTLAFKTQLPYVLNVTLPTGVPRSAGDSLRLLKIFTPDGREAEQSAAFVDALGQSVWTVRCVDTVWMLSTGLSGAAYALWNRLDSQLQPFEDLTLQFQSDQPGGEL